MTTTYNVRPVVERILQSCDLLFGTDAPESAVVYAQEAVESAVSDAIGEAVVEKTEELRAALQELLDEHGRRYILAGPCHCGACLNAQRLLGNCN